MAAYGNVGERGYAGLDDLYTLSGIPEAIDWAREELYIS
jgi:hypothetical protein